MQCARDYQREEPLHLPKAATLFVRHPTTQRCNFCCLAIYIAGWPTYLACYFVRHPTTQRCNFLCLAIRIAGWPTYLGELR